jgi:hypothetical protein
MLAAIQGRLAEISLGDCQNEQRPDDVFCHHLTDFGLSLFNQSGSQFQPAMIGRHNPP